MPAPEKRRLFIIGTILLSLSGIGLVLWIAATIIRELPFPVHRIQYDKRIGFRRIPYDHYVYGTDEFQIPLRYNNVGIRGPDVSPAPAPGVTRIAFLGDSFTESSEVLFEQSWPQQLCTLLEGRSECLNFGVLGYSSVQVLAAYLDRVRPLRPQVVVYAAYQNDWDDNLTKISTPLYTLRESRIDLREYERPLLDELHLWVVNHFRPLLILREGRYRVPADLPEGLDRQALAVLMHRRCLEEKEHGRTGEHPESRREARVQAAVVERLQREVRADGARLLVVLIGDRQSWKHDQMVDLSRRFDFPLVDLREAMLADLDAGRSWRYPINLHWNPYGHRRAAQAIAPHLERLIEE